jgi:hypothetical protein
MLNYWWAIPIAVLYFLVAYTTSKTNFGGWSWFFVNWGWGLIPAWPLLARYSKNIVFDSFVFDAAMIVSYTISLLYFTKSFQKFGPYQYAGCLVILVGLALFKKGV